MHFLVGKEVKVFHLNEEEIRREGFGRLTKVMSLDFIFG